MADNRATDVLIIGGGVIGLRTAIAARKRYPDARVALIEKEPRCGMHASGRNSGVLHAGFYYAPDSFKARFTREGNERLSAYCRERGLRLNGCGKLVVVRDAEQLAVLDELLERGRKNGVKLTGLSAAEAREIEPKAKTFERALYSPTTATVDPAEVVAAFVEDAVAAGIEIRTGTAYVRRDTGGVVTTDGRVSAGYVINAAGLYADKIARDFGFAERYRILPFKGLYLESRPGAYPLNTNIYPVPDLTTPFLGVHLTVGVDGRVKIGPTAVPAFWREQYDWHRNFALRELLEIVRLDGYMFAGDRAGFRRIAWREIPKYYTPRLLRQASRLADGVPDKRSWSWGPSGIRAQLVDITEYRLENDFKLEGDERSLHVLNAVSPAFTCAIPIAEFLLDKMEELI
jgi:L-2-hydroxyglutarate oxidase LhgO